ncbi:MAG: phosphoribosylformylglycinamidine cyclo-ligase, partial [Thermomicrobiaceae bacterium]|nr:phosphoribosylformylglycinamidine cyclo-ligase [Thermomicrobiaceae bacterium]
THGAAVLRGVGLFGGVYAAPGTEGRLALVSSADSVGTKVLLAAAAGRHAGIGVDLVNHCVDDILACGAQPLFFLDYFAAPTLDPAVLTELVEGMTAACREAGCALIGGETAQLPGVYAPGAYDLAGFIVGVVERDRIVDGSAIRDGDALVGLPSSGLHTNGYSLARQALGLDGPADLVRERLMQAPPEIGRPLADVLLEPHRSYLRDVAPLLATGDVHGMAHITGGGLAGNVSRVIPDGLVAVIDATTWDAPPIFRYIQERGRVTDAEMYRVFNMGIGFVLVVRPEAVATITQRIAGAVRIGAVGPGDGPEKARVVGLKASDGEEHQ